MFGLLRLAAMFLVLLSVVYVCLWFWLRMGEKQRLALEWARDRPPLPEHTYVANEMRASGPALRRRLAFWVYAVPIAALCALIYVTNYA